MAQIIITIDKAGNPTIMVQGVKGGACKDLTKAVEQALGTVESDTATREMSENPEKEVTRDIDA